MADLTITAANVTIGGQRTKYKTVKAGEAVTHGAVGYQLSGKYYLADNSTAAKANAKVIFLHAAGTDEYVIAATGGLVDVGATVTVGQVYAVSANGGKIAPIGDVSTTGQYVTTLGVGVTTSAIDFNPDASGVAIP